MKLSFEILTPEEIQEIHNASIDVLENTGMRIESEELLAGLKKGKVCLQQKHLLSLPASVTPT